MILRVHQHARQDLQIEVHWGNVERNEVWTAAAEIVQSIPVTTEGTDLLRIPQS